MEKLKEALSDCIIDFDSRVLLTDLLQEYRLSYNEVNEIINAYIAEQEKRGEKFEKSFLVSGEEKDSSNQIYTVVKGDSKLQEWLSKLKNTESMLYSVEVAGGSKTAPNIFKPMSWCANQNLTDTRPPLKYGKSPNGMDVAKPPPKVEPKKSFDFGAKKSIPQNVVEKETKKSSPQNKQSPETKQSKETKPEEQKQSTAKTTNKKGIASFFSSQTKAAKSETKKASGVIKPPTPKKMQDFFQKSDKTAASTSSAVKEEKASVNTSVQLFCDDDDDEEEKKEEVVEKEEKDSHNVVDVDTSDDEKQLESLREQCREKDEPEVNTSNAGGKKRRRIIDSDDEDEEPEVKHEKKDEKKIDMNESEEVGKSETFLDEDGFVITIKSKKATAIKKPAKTTTPEKSPPSTKEQTKKSTKSQPKQTPKTKQGNIMSFFTKK